MQYGWVCESVRKCTDVKVPPARRGDDITGNVKPVIGEGDLFHLSLSPVAFSF